MVLYSSVVVGRVECVRRRRGAIGERCRWWLRVVRCDVGEYKMCFYTPHHIGLKRRTTSEREKILIFILFYIFSIYIDELNKYKISKTSRIFLRLFFFSSLTWSHVVVEWQFWWCSRVPRERRILCELRSLDIIYCILRNSVDILLFTHLIIK